MTGLRRYANRRDSTEAAIFDALRKAGCMVYPTDQPFDAIVCHRGRLNLVECKTPTTKAGKVIMKPSQEKLIAEGWPVVILKSVDDALQAVALWSAN
jgi:hypothetical protein